MCTLCDSWDHCPSNPKTVHPRPHAATDHDVEMALLLGYAWGVAEGDSLAKLCDSHRKAVDELAQRMRLGPPVGSG